MASTPVTNARAANPPMNWSRLAAKAQNVILLAVTVIFVVIHLKNLAAGHWQSIPFALDQVILAWLFLVRRSSVSTSTRPFDWTVAAIGGWLPLAYVLHASPGEFLGALGFTLQAIGLIGAAICFTSLGRSFGIVAANRGLKTGGPYRLVRHPIYACHLLTGVGFLVSNFWWVNVVLIGIVLAAQIFRIQAEERVLTSSSEYSDYAKTVRWRLIPGIY